MSPIIYRDWKCFFISLFRANVIDYGNAFNLTKYLTNETDYIVWERVDSSITYVRDMLLGKALYPKFQVCEMPADSSSMCRAIKLWSKKLNLSLLSLSVA